MSQYHCISCVHRTADTRSLHNILHFRLKERIGRKPNKSSSRVHQTCLPCPPVSPGAHNGPRDLRWRRSVRTALRRLAGTVFERTIGGRGQLALGIGLNSWSILSRSNHEPSRYAGLEVGFSKLIWMILEAIVLCLYMVKCLRVGNSPHVV